MPGNYGHTARADGSILTGSIYNGDHQNHITFCTPGGVDDYSTNLAQMQSSVDPGEQGTESLPTDLAGEIQRIRNVLKEITGKTYWYESPAVSLAGSIGANVASAATLPLPTAPARSALVTGAVTVTALESVGVTAGTRVRYRFQSALNLVHSSNLILPYAKIYRVIVDEVVDFEYWGSSVWILVSASGPRDCVGTGKDHWGTAVPNGFVLGDATELSATTYEGLFTELLASLASLGRGTAVGTFTTDQTTEICTCTGHGLSDGDVVHVANSGGGLPGGLATLTTYYIRDKTTDTFKLTATRGGSAIDITTNGSGTHSLYNKFALPTSVGRTRIGAGTGTVVASGVDADVDLAGNTLAVPANNTKWITGMAVVFTLASGTITGLVSTTTYYVIRNSSTLLKLASTLANAQNGTAIDFTAKSAPIWSLTYTMTARTLGEAGGQETHAKSSTEALAHVHGQTIYQANSNPGSIPVGMATVGADVSGTYSTQSTGGNVAMNIMNPFTVCNYIVRT